MPKEINFRLLVLTSVNSKFSKFSITSLSLINFCLLSLFNLWFSFPVHTYFSGWHFGATTRRLQVGRRPSLYEINTRGCSHMVPQLLPLPRFFGLLYVASRPPALQQIFTPRGLAGGDCNDFFVT